METQDQTKDSEKMWQKIERSHRRGKIMGGLLIVSIGSLFLAKELGAEIPAWLFSWKMLLIGLGIVTAIKHKFMHPGWIILIGIGGAFLITDLYPDLNIRPFLWPVIIIMIGLAIIFKPRRSSSQWKKWHERHHQFHHRHHQRRQHKHYHKYHDYCETGYPSKESQPSDEDFIDSTAFFAGIKKNIISKKFKGGDIVNVFGGSEINLSQADLEPNAKLDITQVFGGTRLIIPANWEIKSEIVAVLGSVEDKRPLHTPVSGEPSKVLILVGTTVLGGIEIRS